MLMTSVHSFNGSGAAPGPYVSCAAPPWGSLADNNTSKELFWPGAQGGGLLLHHSGPEGAQAP